MRKGVRISTKANKYKSKWRDLHLLFSRIKNMKQMVDTGWGWREGEMAALTKIYRTNKRKMEKSVKKEKGERERRLTWCHSEHVHSNEAIPLRLVRFGDECENDRPCAPKGSLVKGRVLRVNSFLAGSSLPLLPCSSLGSRTLSSFILPHKPERDCTPMPRQWSERQRERPHTSNWREALSKRWK